MSQTPQDRWHKANTKSYAIRLMIKSDHDIISKLDSVPNKVDYIRQLIKNDIEKTGEAE